MIYRLKRPPSATNFVISIDKFFTAKFANHYSIKNCFFPQKSNEKLRSF